MYRLRGGSLSSPLSPGFADLKPGPMSLAVAKGEFGGLRHLASRFVRSLWPGGPGVAGEAWARHWLKPGEVEVWSAMSGPDRRHAVTVARRVAVVLGNPDGAGAARNVLAAALLHDAGKSRSGLGVFGRSAATVVALLLGRRRVAAWRERTSGWRHRVGCYAAHDEIGAALLEAAGSDPLVVAWAREHHQPDSQWSVERPVGVLLKEADDD